MTNPLLVVVRIVMRAVGLFGSRMAVVMPDVIVAVVVVAVMLRVRIDRSAAVRE